MGTSKKIKWWIRGFQWGLGMFILMEILWPLSQDEKLTASGLLFGALLWGIGGLGFGWFISLIESGRKELKEES
jgi:hypothetical protein